jgi:hypothetical protein
MSLGSGSSLAPVGDGGHRHLGRLFRRGQLDAVQIEGLRQRAAGQHGQRRDHQAGANQGCLHGILAKF